MNCYDPLRVGLEYMQKIIGQTMQKSNLNVMIDRIMPIFFKTDAKNENLQSLNPDYILSRYLLVNRGSTEKLEKALPAN